jgi:hypothetical protein
MSGHHPIEAHVADRWPPTRDNPNAHRHAPIPACTSTSQVRLSTG